MRLYLYVLLVVVAIVLAVRGRRRRLPDLEDVSLPRRAWETWELLATGIGWAAAAVLAYVRVQFPYEAQEGCGANFGSMLNASGEHGMVYLDALVILAVPPLVVGWLRRDARWAIGGLLVLLVGFVACWEAAGDFNCPPGT